MSKKGVHIGLILLGGALMVLGLFFIKGEALKAVSGICLGAGAGVFGLSASNLWVQHYLHKHPQERKQAEIEDADERTVMIRSKAKAKSADIIQWFIIGAAYVTILAGSPLWVTLALIGVFLLKNVLELYFIGKYQKEL